MGAAEKNNRVVVITGGSSGIERAMAEAFVRNEAQVIIIGRRADALAAAAQAIGAQCSWQRADVGQREQVAAAVHAIVEQFGRIDVLINNAGDSRGITAEMSLDQAEAIWDHELATNLKGAFLSVPFLPARTFIYVDTYEHWKEEHICASKPTHPGCIPRNVHKMPHPSGSRSTPSPASSTT